MEDLDHECWQHIRSICLIHRTSLPFTHIMASTRIPGSARTFAQRWTAGDRCAAVTPLRCQAYRKSTAVITATGKHRYHVQADGFHAS